MNAGKICATIWSGCWGGQRKPPRKTPSPWSWPRWKASASVVLGRGRPVRRGAGANPRPSQCHRGAGGNAGRSGAAGAGGRVAGTGLPDHAQPAQTGGYPRGSAGDHRGSTSPRGRPAREGCRRGPARSSRRGAGGAGTSLARGCDGRFDAGRVGRLGRRHQRLATVGGHLGQGG